MTRLSSRIVEIEDEGELPIIADAARVAGLILAARQDAGLVEFLKVFEAFPPCADQIKLELGLLELGKALSARTLEETIRQFTSARDYFWASHTARSSRYEAQSYALAIDILVGFFEGRDTSSLRNIIADLKTAAFAYDAYVSQSDPDPLLGMIAAQTTAFTTLAIRLLNLSESLSKRTWLHAAEVIKEQLLVAYTANSALFSGGSSEGVDLLVRPRIERSLLDNHLYMAAMEQWLHTYGDRIDSKNTEDIRLFLAGRTGNPLDAEAADRTASALVQKVNGQVGSTELAEIMEFRKARMRERTSPFIVRAIARISAEFSNLEGFGDQLARLAFMDLALGAISFAEDRLDSSYEQNHQAGYLFHHVNKNPIEKNLHQDFLGWSRSRGMGIDDEVRGIGGGRADLRYSYEGYQIIVEVKQEGRDASFDGLISRYGSQTTQYQVTNARFGVLLVLDKSRALQEPEHLEDIYKAIVIDKGSHRHGVLVVKIAALRPRPSDASR